MARLFNDAVPEHLVRTEVVDATPPIAYVCWFNTDTLAVHQCLMANCDTAGNNNYRSLQIAITSGLITSTGYASGSGIATSSSGVSINTWHHACGIFASATDRRVLLDGGSKGTNATNLTPAGLDNTSIGRRIQSTSYFPMSGMIAEAAIYDLSAYPGATDADKANNFETILPGLVKGFSPLCYPLGLVAYWPLIRGLNDKVGGYNLTASGTTVSSHPRIVLPHEAI